MELVSEGRRVFNYAEVQEKYGWPEVRNHWNRRELLKGRDWAAWQEVVQLVEKNRERMHNEALKS